MTFVSRAQQAAVMAKLNPRAKKFIAGKMKNIGEGRPRKQAVAIAISQARQRGFKIPKR